MSTCLCFIPGLREPITSGHFRGPGTFEGSGIGGPSIGKIVKQNDRLTDLIHACVIVEADLADRMRLSLSHPGSGLLSLLHTFGFSLTHGRGSFIIGVVTAQTVPGVLDDGIGFIYCSISLFDQKKAAPITPQLTERSFPQRFPCQVA